MKHTISLFSSASLSIISSTIIVFPFMVFLKLGSSHTVASILPFVTFYTFRSTGVFFIRGIKTRINSYTLLKLAIYIGIFGSLLGFFGLFFSELEFVAGLLLGLSASWLPMSNTTVNHYKQENNMRSPKNFIVYLVVLLLISSTLIINNNYASFFAIYTIMYLLSLSSLKKITKYQVISHDLENYSYWYLFLFVIFFILIFYLRSSRLLNNALQFDYFIHGVIFLILCICFNEIFRRNKVQKHISNNLSYLTMINGALGNYLFLFSSLYTAGYYGHSSLFSKFYLPYLLGIILTPKIASLIKINSIRKNSLSGLIFGLVIILLTPFFSIGVFTLCIFKGILNIDLNNTYFYQNNLPKDKRIWIKYTVQNIGSIMHQFILMLIGSFLVLEKQTSIKYFFIITSQKYPTLASKSLMSRWNFIATGILILAIISYKIIFEKKQIKN